MLTIKGEISNPQMKQLVNEFRRVQVSRFPIDVVTLGDPSQLIVGFVDSRFPTDRTDKMLGVLYVKEDGERPTLTLDSRLIQNEKFARHNTDYHTKSTSDMKKMLKHMREFIKPFSGQEIAQRSYRGMEYTFDKWQGEPRTKIREVTQMLGMMEYVEALVGMHKTGQLEPNIREVVEQCVPLYDDFLQRRNANMPIHHIALNPDDSVVFTIMKGQEKGSKVVESLEECALEVQQAIGMLRMMNDGDRIPYVGLKVNSNEYWVEGLPQ